MADNNNNIAYSLRAMLEKKDYEEVRRLCRGVPDGPLQKISIYDDTVLHMAAHSRQKDLLRDLLNMVPEDHQLSDIKNTDGNTILHEVATSDAMIDAARELLRRRPGLSIASNGLGEKPIFCAARHGQTEMFKLLALQMEQDKSSPEGSIAHLRRNDGKTLLHISIAAECFDLALLIAQRYPYFIEQRDQSSMTALQYLACNPTAFRRGETQARREFIESLNKSNFEAQRGLTKIVSSIYKSFSEAFSEVFVKKGKKNDSRDTLRQLVRVLVEKDTSWDATVNSQESSTSKEKKGDESALFLATLSNIEAIVEEVLNLQPQAVKRTNKEGMNILHVAIMYRHIDIFNIVIKDEVLSRRLLSTTDNRGNSVLHMVSHKRKSQTSEKMQCPAFQLRDELLLFESVKSASKMLVNNALNNDNKTAEELFAAANEQLHGEAKEWLMRTAENCTILSVFVATVAFAAAYTVPGGPNQSTGFPILRFKPFFAVFISADVISLSLALTSVGTFLSILTSSFPLEDFKKYLFKKMLHGIICLALSVSMMAVAFGATIVLMMSQKLENAVWAVVGFLPVPIFFLSYSPLRSAVPRVCSEWLKALAQHFIPYFRAVLKALGLIGRGATSSLRWIRRHINCRSESDTESARLRETPLASI